MPASSSALSSKRPAGPTKGLPDRSSSLPGCSPTNMTFTRLAPSPKTVCVPVFHRSQAWQSAAAFLSDESVGRGGIKASAGLMKSLLFGIQVQKSYRSYMARMQRNHDNNHESCDFKSRDRIRYGQSFWRRFQAPRKA